MILCANPSAQFQAHQDDIEAAILRVVRGDRFVLGGEVDAFEKEFSNFIGVGSVIGVANGTDALELSLRALGIGPGDEVITVSHTAVATVAAIEASGAIASLVDIEADCFTMKADQLSDALTPKTKALIVVHIYGQSADLASIGAFCKQHKLPLIEDVSQAHGAEWRGQKLGSIGDISCFSCYPTKNLGALGDAGIVATNNFELGQKVRALREYGWQKYRYVSDIPGRNSRLDEVQAAVLRVKLAHLSESNDKRRMLADRYYTALKDIQQILLPEVRIECKHVYHLFVIQTDRRDELLEFMKVNNVLCGIHYPVPIHRQTAYQGRIQCHSNMSTTEGLSHSIISLPIYPELTFSKQDKVINLILEFFGRS